MQGEHGTFKTEQEQWITPKIVDLDISENTAGGPLPGGESIETTLPGSS